MTTRTRIDHGTFCYTAVKEGLIDVERSAHVGIRTVVEDNLGIAIHDAREVHARGPEAIAPIVRDAGGRCAGLPQLRYRRAGPRLRARDRHAGLGRHVLVEAAVLLRGLAGINLIGGDVVEVSPPFDPPGITAIAAAHVMFEQICLWGWTRR
jgi:agmatinase